MQMAKVYMDPHAARRAFLEYRTAMREGKGKDGDKAAMAAYKALMQGERVINLAETMVRGGTSVIERKLPDNKVEHVLVPNLAIARATHQFTYTLGIQPGGSLELKSERSLRRNNRRDRTQFERGTFPNGGWWRDSWKEHVMATVPTIPPRLRPPANAIGNYHILWEATWRFSRPEAPRDPALLRYLGGNFWAIVAAWDLTPVERAGLYGRRPE